MEFETESAEPVETEVKTKKKPGWMKRSGQGEKSSANAPSETAEDLDGVDLTEDLGTELVEELANGDGTADVASMVADRLPDVPPEHLEPLVRRLLTLVETQQRIVPAQKELEQHKALTKSTEDKIKRFERLSEDLLEEIRSILAGDVPEDDTEKPRPAHLPDNDDWRAIKTGDIGLDTLEGMGAKKLEALIEKYPTLGHLEDLRTEASSECVPFKKLLPKGVGETLASAIEEKMLDALDEARGL